jgi:large subunit ribosomal protein L30
MAAKKMLAVVRVRGKVNLTPEIKRTLQQLNLAAQNTCAVLPATGTVMGMIRKVNGYVTFGTVSEATLKELEAKRKSKTENVYYLHPPRKGYGRNGIKRAYTESGALGDRKDDINELLMRMI